jgi:hypothetical protein
MKGSAFRLSGHCFLVNRLGFVETEPLGSQTNSRFYDVHSYDANRVGRAC